MLIQILAAECVGSFGETPSKWQIEFVTLKVLTALIKILMLLGKRLWRYWSETLTRLSAHFINVYVYSCYLLCWFMCVRYTHTPFFCVILSFPVKCILVRYSYYVLFTSEYSHSGSLLDKNWNGYKGKCGGWGRNSKI